MMIGLLGLVFLGLFANIGYYEFMYRKPMKKDVDLIKPYLLLKRRKHGNNF